MPSDYFDEGGGYLEAKQYKEALTAYQYIVRYHPRSNLYQKAYYNVGYIYFLDQQYDSSIVIFKSILISTFNEKEKLGGGIMEDPYANYRHRASAILSEIYYKRHAYDTALHYFALSDTVYPYLHFCGNELSANYIHTALTYSDLYQKLDNKDKAIQSLLQAALITITDNTKVLLELTSLLKGKKDLKKVLDLSLKNIYSKKIQRENRSIEMFYLNYLNTEIAVPLGYKDAKGRFNRTGIIAEIKRSEFYTMIEKLSR